MKNKLLFSNTYKSGAITYLIFKEKEKFIGVCLEFDLEVDANTLEEAKERITDYSHTWLENVANNKLSEELLNRPAPKKYWDIYKQAVKNAQQRLEAQNKASAITVSNPLLFSSYQPYNQHLAFI